MPQSTTTTTTMTPTLVNYFIISMNNNLFRKKPEINRVLFFFEILCEIIKK